MDYVKLNLDWDPEPNAPYEQLLSLGSQLLLFFRLNWMVHEGVSETEAGLLVFHNVEQFRLGSTNDEGYYRGQFRFGPNDLPWGAFYKIQISDARPGEINDWKATGESFKNKNHYLLFFKDRTFEAQATAFDFHIIRNESNFVASTSRQEKLGVDFVAIAADGGTISSTITNSSGISVPVFLDRRVRSETQNLVYINSYPGTTGTICIGKNEWLKRTMEAGTRT